MYLISVQSFQELCEELYVNLELYFKNTHWKNILQKKKCIWFDEKNIKSVIPVEGGQELGHGLVNMYMHHMNIDCMRGWPLGNITLRKPLRTKAMFVEIYKIYKSCYSTGFREKTILIVTMFYWSRSYAFDAKWLKMSSSSEIIAWFQKLLLDCHSNLSKRHSLIIFLLVLLLIWQYLLYICVFPFLVLHYGKQSAYIFETTDKKLKHFSPTFILMPGICWQREKVIYQSFYHYHI